MGMPEGVGIIDTMLGVPRAERRQWAQSFGEGAIRDEASRRGDYQHPAGYMFKTPPQLEDEGYSAEGYEEVLLAEMDRHGIRGGLLPVSFAEPIGRYLVERHPDRLAGFFMVDPNKGMETVRDLERAVRELGAVSAAAFPAGYWPQVPIDDKRMYPIYAKCVELDVPICINAGVPGPRFPGDCQRVDRLDEVCWFFPELKIVTRHGCEPWTEMAVKLMLKWPNLYYSTSAFAPRYYPKDIIDYANTRGADKIIYAGYYPSGLSLERIFTEMPGVAFNDDVWPKFLRENAVSVFKLPF
jgi:predicted TIM-barrel fold metal-dependent hydrolase